MLDTLGYKHYVGYVLNLSVNNNPLIVNQKEMAQYYKIIFLKAGTVCFSLNNQDFVLTGATALCINEKDEIKFIKDPDESIKILLFKPNVINTDFNFDNVNNPLVSISTSQYQDIHYLKPFCHDVKIDNKLIPLSAINAEVILERLEEIELLTQNQNDIYWPCRSRTCLFEILFSLIRQTEKANETKRMPPCLDKSKFVVDIIYYLQSCYYQKISIDELTNQFHTNRTTLISSFKKATGQTVNQYLMQLRLTMASTLLRDTELKIEEISERTGFSDTSYFSKAFKRHINYTPSEYRHIHER